MHGYNIHNDSISHTHTRKTRKFKLHACLSLFAHTLQTGDKEQAMAAFRGYLESRAADLSKNQDLAPYFALPYVPDPTKHPLFKNLFLVLEKIIL